MSNALMTRPARPMGATDALVTSLVGDLAADMAEALDPVSLAERAGITPDPWQANVLRSRANQQILLCSRQSGKSTITAILAVHTALYQPGSLILMLSPGERQSKELLRKATDVFREIGRPIAVEAENTETLELANGSRIVALPGKPGTIRGYSGVRLLIVDEAAWVDDELYFAVRPMLAVSRGRLVLLSTPFGKRGFFHHEWEEGSAARWHKTMARAVDIPRIEAEWLEHERRSIGEFRFSQEYDCQFVDDETQLFPTDLILAAIDPTLAPFFGDAAWMA